MVQGKSTLVLSVVCGTMPGWYPGFSRSKVSLLFFICSVWDSTLVVPGSFMEQGKSTVSSYL